MLTYLIEGDEMFNTKFVFDDNNVVNPALLLFSICKHNKNRG